MYPVPVPLHAQIRNTRITGPIQTATNAKTVMPIAQPAITTQSAHVTPVKMAIS